MEQELKDLLVRQESRLQILENQFKNLNEAIGSLSRQIEDQQIEIPRAIQDARECQETDLNIIFKYISRGLELHPYKGYLHRILSADYHTAKINHYVRYKYAANFVKDNQRILDIACGVGYGSSLLAHESGAGQILGVDLSAEALDFADRIFKHDKITFMQGDCLDSSLFENSQFDLIVSFETIEHVEDDMTLLQNFCKWLKKDGVLIGSAPNQDVMPFNKDEHLYHYKHYTREMLTELLRKTVFDIDFIGYGGWEKIPVAEPSYSHIFVARKAL
jgi:2-polyprenyl-3-methyl-5-hydroxy-6-metoxy-1,4-benzoquinol methylase